MKLVWFLLALITNVTAQGAGDELVTDVVYGAERYCENLLTFFDTFDATAVTKHQVVGTDCLLKTMKIVNCETLNSKYIHSMTFSFECSPAGTIVEVPKEFNACAET